MVTRLVHVLLAALLNCASRWSSSKAGCALVYHRVQHELVARTGQLVPAVSSEDLRQHVRYLLRRYRVVAANELLVEASRRRRGQRFPVSITFDDDLRTHAEVAAPALQDLGATATFFLCGASLHQPQPFWWDYLQAVHDSGDVHPSAPWVSTGGALDLGRTAQRIENMAPQDRSRLTAELETHVGEAVELGVTSEQVAALVEGGFEIGFHTSAHDALDTLDDAELDEALTAGRSALEEAAGRPLRVIAYPHGRADGRVAAAAQRAGYITGFTTAGTRIDGSSHPMLLGRIDPSGLTAAQLAFRLSRSISARRP